MTIRRKQSLFAVAACVLALVAAACTNAGDGSDLAESDPPSPSTTSAPITAEDVTCDATRGFGSISIAWDAPDNSLVVMQRNGADLVETAGSGGYEDLGVEVGETYSYSVKVRNSDVTVMCGEDLSLVAEVGQPTCSVAVDKFAVVTWELTDGRAEVYRNGERVLPDIGTLSSPFIDTAAPVDLPLTYEVVAVDSGGQDRPSKTASCGVVTVDALPEAETELQVAQEAAKAYLAPYGYVTVVPICATCETEKVDVYFAFDNESRVALNSWIGNDEQPVTDNLWFTDPLAVPTLLLEALANGDNVTSVTDEATGLIVQWTINGEGAILECLEMDMAPLDLRQKDCSGSVYTD